MANSLLFEGFATVEKKLNFIENHQLYFTSEI